MNSAPLAIRARAASKVYSNGLRALEPIDFTVREGEFVSIIGPSGCGKSTLLKLLAGLDTPSAGEITLWPEVGRQDRRLAFVFQHATLMPWATVEVNVRLPFDLAGARGEAQEEKLRHALELVGLQEFRRAYPRQLSGGMQMRVSIARALALAPSLLLMDEPFGALDEITRSRLDRDVRALWHDEALTALFVTHNIFEAVYLSTRVLVMSARPGRLCGEVAIDEPHPRGEAFRGSARFAQYCAQLSRMLAAASGEAGEGPAP